MIFIILTKRKKLVFLRGVLVQNAVLTEGFVNIFEPVYILKEGELTIYKYYRNSSKSITSVCFHKRRGLR